MKVGDYVKTKDAVKPAKYAGRKGEVSEVRRAGPGKVEVGVRLGTGIVWFLVGELETAYR